MKVLLAVFTFLVLVCSLLELSEAAQKRWGPTKQTMMSSKKTRQISRKRQRNKNPGFSMAGPPIVVSYPSSIANCPALGNIGCTGVIFDCKSDCIGVLDGRYPSCRGCDLFVECASYVLYEMPACACGQEWNDIAKKCQHKSHSTCTRCPESGSWRIDFETGDVSDGTMVFDWDERPPIDGPHPLFDASGVIKINPPICTKVIFIHMKVANPENGAPLYHLAGNRLCDGFGDFFGTYNLGPHDYEVSQNYGDCWIFTSMAGGYNFHYEYMAPGVTDVCIELRPGQVQMKSGFDLTMDHANLWTQMGPTWLAINRNLYPYLSAPINRSKGVRSVEIQYSC